MLTSLLILHAVIGLLLATSILLQKTSSDGLANLTGNNAMAKRLLSSPMVNITYMLAAAFMINALILGNISTNKNANQIEFNQQKTKPVDAEAAQP